MTIASSTNKTSPFAGNDTTGPWAFTFKTFDEADLEVVKLASGVESVLVLNTDYTVSLNGDQETSPGGEITTTANVATGETLVIRRVVEALQGVDLVQGGAFNPSVLETALDRLTMLAQQLKEEVDRSVKVGLTSGDDPDDLVANLAASEAAAAASEAAAAASEAAAAASAASIDPDELIHRAGGSMTGLLNLAASTDIASGATVDLGTATGNTVPVTHSSGTTATTSLGGATVKAGTVVKVIASISGGTWSMTHHATNLILPGGVNITFANGDAPEFLKMHDTNSEWKLVGGVKADGTTWTTSIATWTPGISFGGATTGITYGTQAGKLVSDGKKVSFTGQIVLTSKGSATGGVRITGLPITNGAYYSTGSVRITNLSAALNGVPSVLVEASATTMLLEYLGNASTTVAAMTDAHFSNTTALFISGEYFL